jgi:AcrR family transcriptional regulator
VAAVGRRAGVSRALVHYHFETREVLLGAAIESTYRVARSGVTDVGGPRLGTLEALAAKVEASLPIRARSRLEWELWVELWAGAVRDPELRTIAAGVYGRLHAVLAAIVERGVEEGILAPLEVDPAVDRILALMDGYGIRVLLGDPAVSADEARRQVRQGLAGALGLDPARLPSA